MYKIRYKHYRKTFHDYGEAIHYCYENDIPEKYLVKLL